MKKKGIKTTILGLMSVVAFGYRAYLLAQDKKLLLTLQQHRIIIKTAQTALGLTVGELLEI